MVTGVVVEDIVSCILGLHLLECLRAGTRVSQKNEYHGELY